jgi:hypothetical protein
MFKADWGGYAGLLSKMPRSLGRWGDVAENDHRRSWPWA